jgi:hypothetical protein
MCCKLPKGFACALGIDDKLSICSPGTANGKVRLFPCCLVLKNENLDNGREEMYLHNWEDIAASNSMEMRKPESFLGFQYPIG